MESFNTEMTRIHFYNLYISRTVKDEFGCWIWQGSKTIKGYGHAKADGTYWLVHRYIYTHCHGPIPYG
jgi:hypothetical protein